MRRFLNRRFAGTIARFAGPAAVLAAAALATLSWGADAALAQDAQAPAPEAEAAAAPEAQDEFFESIDVNVVNVDVYVTDKKGNRIRGLTKDDFELFEDGRPMTITNFYAVDDGRGEADGQTELEAEPVAPLPVEPRAQPEVPLDQRLHLVIYVDNWNIKPFNRNRVFTSIREFLRTRLAPTDRVMLMTYDREPHVRRPFTSDPATIASALFEIERISANGARQDSERRQALREINDARDEMQASIVARMFAEAAQNDLGFAIESIKNTVRSLAGLPGRKAILYVSDGLPMVPGEDLFHAVHEKFSSTTGTLLESRMFDMSRRYQEMVALANANRVTFYTLDAEGLRVSTSASAEERTATASGLVDSVHWSNIQSTLQMIAEETGGTAIINSNDPTRGLARIGDDFSNYYSLGYAPAHSGDGRFHEIEVKVRNKAWVVRHRDGYRDKTHESRMSDGVTSALFYDVESNPLGIVLDRGEATARDDGHYVVPVEVRIPIGRLVLLPQGELHVARVRVFLGAMDEQGNISEVQQATVPLEIPEAELAHARQQVYVFTMPVLMRRGPQKLAVGVRDDVAQTSSFTVRSMSVGGR